MITISEIKKALLRLSETEIISQDNKEKEESVTFKKNGDSYTVFLLPENELSKTNIKITKLIRFMDSLNISNDECTLIENSLNITNKTPCKLINLRAPDNKVIFLINNTHTDILDSMDKISNEESRLSNIIILILGMIVQIAITTEEILEMAKKIVDDKKQVDDKNGK